MKKLLERTICIASAIVMIWTVASYVEIISKNLDENPTYSEANIIVKLMDEWGN